ncbi:MAG: Cys-tRNA(Pro) deacylase [Peptoniphilaceae bacterium]
MKKTNAMRILDRENINYDILEYNSDQAISGKEVASYLAEDESQVFKTLVTKSKNKNYVFVIPVNKELDLKVAANVSNEKKIEMIAQKELFPLTGYIHGGCSPIGMKKSFETYIDISAEDLTHIYVSGGKLGMQIKIDPKDLSKLVNAKFAELGKEA